MWLGIGPVVGFSEHGRGPLGYVKLEELPA